MEKHARKLATVSAVLAFLLCLVGGTWLFLASLGEDDLFSTTLGLYFMGKAFFVGPMLYLTALQLPGRQG